MSGFGNSGFGNSGFGAPVPSSYGAPNYGGGGGSFPSSNSSPSPYVQQPPFGGVVSTPSYTTTNTGGFGTATPATPAYSTGFGSQQQQQPPQPSGMMFGSSPNVAIGASVHSITFGQPTLTSTHFGSNTTPSGGFGGFGTTSSSGGFRGNSNTSNNSATLHSAAGGFGAPQFGGPANVDFGTSPSTQQTSSGYPQPSFGGPAYASLATPSADPMNPFLSAPQQQQQPDFAQSMSFGRSSNVVTTNDTFTSQSGFGPGFGSGAATRGPFDNSIMPQASSVQASTPPFGMSAQDDPFDDGMTDEVPSSTLPFGQPVTAFATSSTAQLTSHSTLNSRGFFDTGATLSTQEEDRANDRLAMLNARIAAKKKKFEEEKRKRGTAMQGAVAASALRAEAASFEPLSSVAPFEPSSHNGASTMEPSSVAQRNAMRFSESKDTVTRSQLPADLLLQSAEVTAAQTLLRNSGGRSGRENLENAVSLVGICQYMCPDEELLRREREGDIQLLERPVPDGILHPTHWTLRDTMVKRFRRSAADYKLDVPEWVRPPDVLERVCSYLEEWVMERDRQGPDPRYKDAAPPPLDVYQFIWDRTRMVRKDFILQNYVGTGGRCDARAVRCHERIARWHCMCEHQLSHVTDFVVMQSQQNIQELGQTMKTLNQFYDDSMGRALVEVPDEDGRELRTDMSGFVHGCEADTIQGSTPIDYDGSPLANVDAENVRLIGKHAAYSPHHGTAEPEMRGLYILLTIDNDGGMEVLKYAARLFQDRPEVYHSEPVQLALSIFMAKNDMNYARFFSILRSPSTPYLAACLMFKHVEAMRKTAFRIFAKTYGGRTKDGEIAYDSYPLRRLTGLLCYEDDDETRAACHHYNITVVEEGRGRETINWKQTPFREPKDPEKGTVILLRPRKMMKTIESKLKGATRLGVCRGELSGEGSFLLAAQVQPVRGLSLQNSVQAATSGTTQAQAEALGIQKMEDEDRERNSARKRQDEEESQRIEDERRQKESAIRQFSEQEQQKVEAKARQLQIQLQEESARRVQEEIERKRLEREHEAKRLEMEQMAVRKVAAELVRQREQEAAELKEALRQEEEARVWEEAEKQRQAEEHHRQELERKKRQEELDAELLRQEVESRRLEHLKEQGNERLRREMAALKLRQKLKEREDAANKILVWKLLKDRTARLTIADRTKATLIALKSRRSLSQAPYNYPAFPVGTVIYQEAVIRADLTTSLESELSERQVDCKLNDMLTETARIALEAKYFPSSKYGGTKSTILFKVAVLFPQSRSSQDQVMSGLVLSWIQSQLDFDKVSVARSTGLDVRVVVVDGSTQSASSVCDVALLVVPPPWSDLIHERIDDLKSLSLLIDADVPRIILALCECFEPLLVKDRNILFPSVFSGNFEEISIVSNVDVGLPTLKQSLLSCVDCLARAFVFYPPRRIERLSIGRIFFKCLSEVLWQDGALEEREDIVLHACAAMHLVINEIDTFCANILQTGYLWPSSEFAGDGVPGYFGENANLPLNWAAASLRHHIEPEMMRYVGMLDRPFSEIIELLVRDGNPDVQLECGELLDNRLFRRCLQTALLWRIEVDECEVSSFVYLPLGQTDEIVRRAATTQLADGLRKVQNCLSRSPLGDSDALVECIFIEEIDRPPQDTPIATREKLASKRPWTDSVAAVRTSGRSVRTATPRSFAYKKRQRMVVNSGQRRMSQNMAESISFTKRVMRLLGGEVKDMILGNGSLSSALKGAPPLNADIGIPPS